MKTKGFKAKRDTIFASLIRSYYDLKCSSIGYFWTSVFFIGVSSILVLEANLDLVERQVRLALLTEVISPIMIGFFSNTILMNEIESGSAVFPATRLGLPVLWSRRVGALFLTYCLVLASVLTIVNIFYPEIGYSRYAFASLPTCLFISGLVSAFSFVFKEMNAGFLAGTFIWSLNFVGARAALSVFGPQFYIFYGWAALKYSLPPGFFWTNKTILTFFALVLYLLCIFLLQNSEVILASKR